MVMAPKVWNRHHTFHAKVGGFGRKLMDPEQPLRGGVCVECLGIHRTQNYHDELVSLLFHVRHRHTYRISSFRAGAGSRHTPPSS